MTITLCPAEFSHANAYADYIRACSTDPDIDHYDDAIENSDEYLLSVINAAQGVGLPENHVPQATFFAREGEQILGAIRVRLGNTEIIENVIGHVGYEVRPDARNRGVAKRMLNWVLSNVVNGPVMISCGTDNIASQRVIEAAGATFVCQRFDETFGDVRCYRV